MPDNRQYIAEIRRLNISFSTPSGVKKIADDMQLAIGKGEIIGIYGDSGTGKSVCTLAMLGLTPESASVDMEVHFQFKGSRQIIRSPYDRNWREIRRNHIGYVFQQAPAYLNPVIRCGIQVKECLPDHLLQNQKGGEKAILAVLDKVGILQPERIFTAFPHQFSVGQQQRILLAMALLRSPSLIIADEPFANVDKNTERNIRDLIQGIRENELISFLIVSHDVQFLRDVADRIYRMESGKLYEDEMEGTDFSLLPKKSQRALGGKRILRISDIRRSYRKGSRFALRSSRREVLKGISFDAGKGDCIGIMGRSGCGKTTLARILVGLDRMDSGSLHLGEKRVSSIGPNGWKGKARNAIQLVFQDPFTSMDPSKTVGSQIREGIACRPAHVPPFDLEKECHQMQLELSVLDHFPAQLSGGQLQRICLIRALAVYPEILICDESFSALDRNSKRIIVDNLGQHPEIQVLIVISHDPEIVQALCNKVIVMEKGRILEMGTFEDLYEKSEYPETKLLMGKF